MALRVGYLLHDGNNHTPPRPPHALPLNTGTLLEVLIFREVGLHSHSWGEGTRNAMKREILKDHASSAGYEPNAFLPPTEQVAWPSLPPPSQPPQ